MKIIYNPNLNDVYEGYLGIVEDLSIEIMLKSSNLYEKLKELKDIKIELLRDPEEQMVSFNELYAEAQSRYNRVCSILIEFIQEKTYWKRMYLTTDKVFSRARSYLLTTDTVSDLRNQNLQEAKVATELHLILSLVNICKISLEDMKDMIEIANIKKDKLDNAITNMSRQQRVTESLIGLGYPVKTSRESN